MEWFRRKKKIPWKLTVYFVNSRDDFIRIMVNEVDAILAAERLMRIGLEVKENNRSRVYYPSGSISRIEISPRPPKPEGESDE